MLKTLSRFDRAAFLTPDEPDGMASVYALAVGPCQATATETFTFACEQETVASRAILGNGLPAEALAERTRARIAPSTTLIAVAGAEGPSPGAGAIQRRMRAVASFGCSRP